MKAKSQNMRQAPPPMISTSISFAITQYPLDSTINPDYRALGTSEVDSHQPVKFLLVQVLDFHGRRGMKALGF